jgi:AcrR family transcriptional regulator
MNRSPARERLLKAASELFYADGVTATGIDTITARAGVAKMSLYNNFASKAELVSAYLDARTAEWREGLDARLAACSTPAERILAVFDSYRDYARPESGRGFRGCGLFNAAAELRADDPGRAIVKAQKDEVEEIFREQLSALTGESAAASQMAEQLAFLLEGAMARAGLEGHEGRLMNARRMAETILQNLAPPPHAASTANRH